MKSRHSFSFFFELKKKKNTKKERNPMQKYKYACDLSLAIKKEKILKNYFTCSVINIIL